METFTIVFLVALGVSVAVKLWLLFRHINHVRTHRSSVPNAFSGKISLENHQKAADYTQAQARFSAIELAFSSFLLLAWTLAGGLQLLDNAWSTPGWGVISHGVAVLVSTFFVISLIELPLSAYHTFIIEQRFGFNNTTARLFFSDFLKQTLLTIIMGVPLAFLVLWLMESSGTLWWLYVWLVWTSFTLFLMWVYPTWIAPIFNKFTPLSNAELEQRIDKLLERCGFTSDGVFVMDGSKRSGHGNAYFTGLGGKKRIVFFDTLLHTLEGDEIEAVLAHELGHFKRKHVLKRIVTMTLMSLLALATLGWLMEQTWFYTGLGIDSPSNHTALVLFLLTLPVFSFFIQPISSFMMRKHEFEADNFAAEQTSATHLIKALVKLYSENANTLTPDPLFSAFHDSHPPAPVRIAFLSSKIKESNEEFA